MYSPTASLKESFTNLEWSHAKVCYLNVLTLIQQQVFWFEITMAGQIHIHTHMYSHWKSYTAITCIPYFMLVAKIHSGNDLPEETPCLSFWKPPLSNKVIKEFASWNMLQHKVSANNRYYRWLCVNSTVAAAVVWQVLANSWGVCLQVCVVLIDIVQAKHMRMVYQFHDGYLSLHLVLRQGWPWY